LDTDAAEKMYEIGQAEMQTKPARPTRRKEARMVRTKKLRWRWYDDICLLGDKGLRYTDTLRFFPPLKFSKLCIHDLQKKSARYVTLLISFAENNAIFRDPELETCIDSLVNVDVDQDLRVLSHA
jgi:hypothetical protein